MSACCFCGTITRTESLVVALNRQAERKLVILSVLSLEGRALGALARHNAGHSTNYLPARAASNVHTKGRTETDILPFVQQAVVDQRPTSKPQTRDPCDAPGLPPTAEHETNSNQRASSPSLRRLRREWHMPSRRPLAEYPRRQYPPSIAHPPAAGKDMEIWSSSQLGAKFFGHPPHGSGWEIWRPLTL